MDAIVTDKQQIVLTDMMPNIDDIYSDMRSNMATLILGPDLLSKGELSVRQALYNELTKTPNNGILHFYPSNGIFLFDSPNSKFNCQKAAAKFYTSIEPEREIFEKLVDLPFNLVLNASPDKNLVNILSEKKRKFQFSYFSRRPNKNQAPIKEPTAENPLIYNLFGSVEEFQSLVLDFEDMFNHLTILFNNTNVPDEVRTILKNTYTFIFLGFQLEKWDTQLLFRYINMNEQEFDNRKKNYTRKPINIDEGSESFFSRQLNLKYYLAPVEFMSDIHKKYSEAIEIEENEKLQKMPLYDAIAYLIDNDKFDKTLKLVKEKMPTADEMQLAVLNGQFGRYMNIKSSGTLPPEDLAVMCNKLKYTIYDLIDDKKDSATPRIGLDGMATVDVICYYIGKDDLDGAIDYLQKYISSDITPEYYNIKSQYTAYKNYKIQGTQRFEDLEIMRNKIRQAIFSITDQLKELK